MRKRIFALLLGIVMVCGLAACGGEASSKDAELPPLTEAEIPQMFTSPDDFKDREVTLTGVLTATPEKDEEAWYFQMFADAANYDDLFIVKYAQLEEEITVDTYYKVTGVVAGTFTGENMLGAEITAPTIVASQVEKVEAMDVIDPAQATVDVNLTEEQSGCSVTVQKVEFGKKETRVYLSATNNGTSAASLNTYSAKILQNGKQMEISYDFIGSYPELSSDLLAGATSEGILCFPAMEQASFELFLTGSANDYMDTLDYHFTVEIGA